MKFFVFSIWFLLGASLSVLGETETAHAEVKQGPHVELELVEETKSVLPGESYTLGLRLKLEPTWHTYWKYPGDTGATPIFDWKRAGSEVVPAVAWPTPEKFEMAHLANYGYGDETLLLFEFPPIAETGTSLHDLDLEILVCQEECIPFNAQFSKMVEVSSAAPAPTSRQPLFERARSLVPIDQEFESLEMTRKGMEVALSFSIPGEFQEGFPLFIPDSAGQITNGAAQTFAVKEGKGTLTVEAAEQGAPLSGLLLLDDQSPAYRIGSEADQAASSLSPEEGVKHSKSIIGVLLGAFLGGLILNLMPCVFPVISLKVLGFVKKAGKNRWATSVQAFLFSLGVLISFWILAAVVFSLRASGQELGWGFQLQTPWFVAFLALLLFSVGLNLAGVFEFGYGIQALAGRGEQKAESKFGSFASGMLATLLATPCTAPFMAPAIGYALTQPFATNFAIFTALGLGMAFPYVLLSTSPRLIQLLPKPGGWMVTFQQVVSFPVFATVIWLVWVYEQQVQGGVVWILIALLIVSIALWLFGKMVTIESSRGKRWIGLVLTLLLLAAAFWVALPDLPGAQTGLDTGNLIEAEDAASAGELDKYGLLWHPYSEKFFEEQKSKQLPIYIDFTAAWCITCQVNKKVVFSSEEVRAEIQNKKVVLIRGDWTNEDPEITKALESYERLGVPLNILWNPDKPDSPKVFPSVLTAQMVLSELRELK